MGLHQPEARHEAQGRAPRWRRWRQRPLRVLPGCVHQGDNSRPTTAATGATSALSQGPSCCALSPSAATCAPRTCQQLWPEEQRHSPSRGAVNRRCLTVGGNAHTQTEYQQERAELSKLLTTAADAEVCQHYFTGWIGSVVVLTAPQVVSLGSEWV